MIEAASNAWIDLPRLNVALLLFVLGLGARWLRKVNASFIETAGVIQHLKDQIDAHERLDETRFENHEGRIDRVEDRIDRMPRR